MTKIYCGKKVTICASDTDYLQRLSDERQNIGLGGGVQGTYWSQRRGHSVDPLYNEPLEWSYVEKKLPISVQHEEFDDGNEEGGNEGWSKEFDGTASMTKTDWEARFGTSITPKAGDVIFASGQYFDVVKAGRDGYNQGLGAWTSWKLGLMRRTVFVPERKVE